MYEALNKLNPYLEKMYKKTFTIRSGLHYGKVIIGTIGIEGSRKLTAIGDTVNFASRIKTANKEHGTRIMIADSTVAAMDQAPEGLRPLGEVTVRGRESAIGIFTLQL